MGELGRLRWRCRRGRKELDLLLERYLEEVYPTATPAEKEAFARLIECSESELVAWLIYGQPCPDPALGVVLASLRCGLNLSLNARE